MAEEAIMITIAALDTLTAQPAVEGGRTGEEEGTAEEGASGEEITAAPVFPTTEVIITVAMKEATAEDGEVGG